MSKQQTFHRDFAIQHYSGKLGKSYQVIALLGFIWSCIDGPWESDPSVKLAASRLEFLIAGKSGRARAVAKLVKIGAIKKGRGSRSGCTYTMQRPDIADMSAKLQKELAEMGTLDYRFNRAAMVRGEIAKPKSKTVHPDELATPRLPRKKITERLEVMQVEWPKLGKLLEITCAMGKKRKLQYSGRHCKPVETLGAWLTHHELKHHELAPLVRILADHKVPHKPTGNVLLYVFEGDTAEKQAYLQEVLRRLRSPVQLVAGAT